ncbi:MAG: hypothetical protein ACFFEF_19155 [Candidatus Thorarchaeota archaeon]
MDQEDTVEMSIDGIGTQQEPLCPFCKYQGTKKGSAILFLVWVLAPVLLLLLVLFSEM